MSDIPKLDEIQQCMLDKTGYFVDVQREEKHFLIGIGTMVKTEATDAEMKFWAAWETYLRETKTVLDRMSGKLDQIISNLDAKAAPATNSVDPA